MKTAIKPANYYASIATIPDYVETAIASLGRHDLYNFTDDLLESIRDRRWSSRRNTPVFVGSVDEWLSSQSVDTFKSLHKWVSNELI